MNDDTTRTAGPSESGPPERIGPYRILQKVGEGGMGEVYEAEQEKPVRRKVALKVIKWGMDTKQVVARFESERQALALMDHPAIARVYDGGATERGRPFFAMEFVKGEPITSYCDRHRLNTRERLKLFMQVCDGVQHAHQKGIIHRDLKPSNVLVTIQDDKPVPKIIDFGVAKATEQRLTEKTVFTQMGVLIGTPAYMSPEQAEMTVLDIDTRTDVYSLGVMLYELMTGVLPFDPKELRSSGFDEIRRKIREEEPPIPSARLSTLSDVAKKRKIGLPALRRELKGDLDWIAMRAMEKDRTRRYGSPNELAADLSRHLNHEPVIAGPPSATYRLRKFVRRHRLGVAFAAAVVLLLGGFAARERIQSVRIAREAQTANQVTEFLVGLFEVSDPGETRGKTITARELLDLGAERIERELADQPQVQARMMHTMGTVYHKLGLYEEAESLLKDAVAERRRMLGDDHPETLHSTNNLASLYLDEGRYDEAELLILENLRTRKRVLGEDHPDTLISMDNLASLYYYQSLYDEAEPLCIEVLAARKLVLGEDHRYTLNAMNNLANLYFKQGRYDRAEPLYLETFETRRRILGDDHPQTVDSMYNLALVYKEQGRYDRAEPLYLETFETRRRILGEDHPTTLWSMNSLAHLYKSQGRYSETEPLYIAIIEARKRVLGEDHPDTLRCMDNLASLYTAQGRYDEAEPLYIATLEALKRVLGENHLEALVTVHNLSCLYRDTDRVEEARRGFERVQRFCDDKLAPTHTFTLANLEEHAKLLRRTGDDAGAERLEARAKAIRGE